MSCACPPAAGALQDAHALAAAMTARGHAVLVEACAPQVS